MRPLGRMDGLSAVRPNAQTNGFYFLNPSPSSLPPSARLSSCEFVWFFVLFWVFLGDEVGELCCFVLQELFGNIHCIVKCVLVRAFLCELQTRMEAVADIRTNGQ